METPENDNVQTAGKRPISVHINQLQINGLISSTTEVANYLGITYAEIPARFRQARPVDPQKLSGIVDATHYGPRCHQPIDGPPDDEMAHLFAGVRRSSTFPLSEFDCLKLNIYTPPPSNPQTGSVQSTVVKLPVLVWIHGGAFTFGDGNSEYDGNFLVQKSIALGRPFIYVAFNYRLGYYGFLSSRELKAEALQYGEVGYSNQGLYDQRLALQWVQNNIHYFGGDGSNVTIAGESSGAWSVLAHLRSNVPVCQRGMIMSCPEFDFPQPEDAQKTFDRLVATTGVSASASGAEKLAALRALTPLETDNLLDGMVASPLWDSEWFIYQDVNRSLASAVAFPSWVKGVTIGWTRDECIAFAAHWLSWNFARIEELIKLAIPDDEFAQDVIREYGITPEPSEAALRGLLNLATDCKFASVPFLIAAGHSSSTPISIYRFDQVDVFAQSPLKGYAYHSLDNVFLCRLPAVAGQDAPQPLQDTANVFSQACTLFVYGNQPWKEYNTARQIMILNGNESGLVEWPGTNRWKRLTSIGGREAKSGRVGQRLLGLRPSSLS